MLKLNLPYFGHLIEELTHWERPWCWEILKAGGEGDDRAWDDWMASLTWCTWVWASSGSWWWTGKLGVLHLMGLQRVGNNGFSSGHVWMWELDCKESWALKNWCFWHAVLEKTLESPLDCKDIQPVHLKGNQSWMFTGRTDTKTEIPVLWPPHAKGWLTGKDSDAGRDWEQEEKGMTENEMAGWKHQLNGHEFEWTLGVSDGQGDLVCCDSWSRKESDMTERLIWIELEGLKWTEMFFWNSLEFSMIQRMLAIWSLIPLRFLNPAWTSGTFQFTYCWNLA